MASWLLTKSEHLGKKRRGGGGGVNSHIQNVLRLLFSQRKGTF